MCRNVELHERILSCIQVNNINHLNIVVKTCLENNHSIHYLLQKINDAVDKKYNPHHTIEDKELSILILKFGGPSLLQILHRAKRFPSPSTAYRFLDERKIEMKSHISFDVEDMIVQALRNVLNADTSDSFFVMCKMDGT